MFALTTRSFTSSVYKLHRFSLRTFSQNENKKKIAFLGTPEVAVNVLDALYKESISENSNFEICTVVSQAPVRTSKKILKSPVQLKAESLCLPVLHPESAKEEAFLSGLEKENIDLCVTAAYGNYLPKRFLNIPKFGTVNIHPSLLPKYRGAAPVQRCLENGDADSGVTLLYTVSKMDSGPIISKILRPLQGDELSPVLMQELFATGTKELIKCLPKIFMGEINISSNVTFQNDDIATHAPKLSTSESFIDFEVSSAQKIYNKFKAFYGWPEIYTFFRIYLNQPVRIPEFFLKMKLKKIIFLSKETVEMNYQSAVPELKDNAQRVIFCKYHGNPKEMVGLIRCEDGNYIGILELQADNRKTVNALSFFNGYSGKFSMSWLKQEEIRENNLSM